MTRPASARVNFRPLVSADWPQVAEIYRQGIESGNATFETEVPGWDAWNADRSPDCRTVAEVDGRIVGFAALSPVSGRCVYDGVREVTIYVAEPARGRGILGTHERLGRFHDGRWRDVVLMERRSRVAGVD